jgi:predicted O-methyltransferase YrrM
MGRTSFRRRLARWLAPEVEAELKRTRAKLKRTRAQLAAAGFDLPPAVEATIAQAREEHLTYLKAEHLRALAAGVLDVEHARLPGLVVEAGTARGGSAIVMAAAKAPERPMKVYDVFGMIPPPGDEDGPDVHERYAKIAAGEAQGVGGDTYYGYRDDLYEEVTESFSRLGVPAAERNVELVRGLFEDTIDLDEPVAFAHLDGDWYESTMTCLERIAPLLVPGGRIVLDDYYMWSGCRRAVDEYFGGRDGFRLEQRARLHVVRG